MEFKKVEKEVMNRVLDNFNIYKTKADAQNQTNAATNVNSQYWGDDDRDLEVDLESGLIWETQEDGNRVAMGYMDKEGLANITGNTDEPYEPPYTTKTGNSSGTAYEPPYTKRTGRSSGTAYEPPYTTKTGNDSKIVGVDKKETPLDSISQNQNDGKIRTGRTESAEDLNADIKPVENGQNSNFPSGEGGNSSENDVTNTNLTPDEDIGTPIPEPTGEALENDESRRSYQSGIAGGGISVNDAMITKLNDGKYNMFNMTAEDVDYAANLFNIPESEVTNMSDKTYKKLASRYEERINEIDNYINTMERGLNGNIGQDEIVPINDSIYGISGSSFNNIPKEDLQALINQEKESRKAVSSEFNLMISLYNNRNENYTYSGGETISS